VWRLQPSAFIGWAVALMMFGLIFGNLTEQIQALEGHAKDWWTAAGGTDQVVEAYKVSIIQMAGMFVAIYLVQVLLRMRVDEADGTLESVLASGFTRTRWLWGHLMNAIAGCVALTVLFAVSMGLTAGQVLGDTGTQVRELVWAGLVQIPGILVVGTAVAAVLCVVPRWSVPASWAILLSALVVGPMFGPGLNLPAWVQDLSPFTHSPQSARTRSHRRTRTRSHRRLPRPRRDRAGLTSAPQPGTSDLASQLPPRLSGRQGSEETLAGRSTEPVDAVGKCTYAWSGPIHGGSEATSPSTSSTGRLAVSGICSPAMGAQPTWTMICGQAASARSSSWSR